MYGRTSVGLFLALGALLVVLFSAAAVDGANTAVNFNFKGLIRTFDTLFFIPLTLQVLIVLKTIPKQI
jgi:hypothetical protein